MPVYKKVNKNFFKKWTHEMSYVLGFFAADGYVTLNRRGACFWSIQITDKKLLEEIRNTIESKHRITIRKGNTNNKTQYRLQIGSKEMCRDLQRLGINENKTKSMSIPCVPERYLHDFIRGYFDGDGNVWIGYIHKERQKPILGLQTAFTSCSIDFLKCLRARLYDIGIKGGSIYTSKAGYSRLQFSIRDSLKIYDFMYNHKNFSSNRLFLKRKKVIFEKYKKMRV